MAAEGIEAKGFAADVRDPSSLAKVLERMTETLGPIDVFSTVRCRGFHRQCAGPSQDGPAHPVWPLDHVLLNGSLS